jgi:hypothetical protein
LSYIEDLIQFDPALVEESVLLASDAASAPFRRRYRRERNAIYEITESEEREAAFSALDLRWFARLGLGSSLLKLLEEFEGVLARVSRCLVLRAARKRDEGADLHASRRDAPLLAVKLTPGSLLDFDRVAPMLRSELLHVEDMLDPAFGYERDPPSLDADPVYEKLVRDRYRVLWNVSVAGRLKARAGLSSEDEARSRREFLETFALLGADAEEHLERFFQGPRPSHGELLSFARSMEGRAAGRCPLCRFPTTRFLGEAEPPDPRVEEVIRRDFPLWNRSQGICVQCADLYEARIFARPEPSPVQVSLNSIRKIYDSQQLKLNPIEMD